MNKQIIIKGPQGCGMETQGRELAASRGITCIVEDWDGMTTLPAECVAWTNVDGCRVPDDAEVVDLFANPPARTDR